MFRWLNARWTLGWALIKHVILAPFARGRSSPRRWLERIGQEALGPTPRDNWQHFEGSSRCINCGLCDLVDLPGGAAASQWITSAARLPSDAPLARDKAAALHGVAESIEQICP
ncbi:MAG TPA: hypothetical protein VFH51_19570, partial [Myxococcota bacterium]|nr:hypothetical protein [Myxococcota bacterium]